MTLMNQPSSNGQSLRLSSSEFSSYGISNLAHTVSDYVYVCVCVCVCVCMHAHTCTDIKWTKRIEIKDSKQLIAQLAVLTIMGM